MDKRISSSATMELFGVDKAILSKLVGSLKDAAKYCRGPGVERLFSYKDFFAMFAGLAHRRLGSSKQHSEGVAYLLSSMSVTEIVDELEKGHCFAIPATIISGTRVPGFLMPIPESDLSEEARDLVRQLDLSVLNREAEKLFKKGLTMAVPARGRKPGKPHRPKGKPKPVKA